MKKDILKKLGKYAASTAATLVAGGASAGIVYTDVDPDDNFTETLNGDGTVYDIDLNNDGLVDIALLNYTYADGTYYTVGTNTTTPSFVSTFYTGGLVGAFNSSGAVALSSGGADIRKFTNGESIGSTAIFDTGGFEALGGSFYRFVDIYAPAYSFVSSYTSGGPNNAFAAGETGIIGVQFSDAGGAVRYGWVRVTVNAVGSNANFTVLDYAYERCPDQPIAAGATFGGSYEMAEYSFAGCDSVVAFGSTYMTSGTFKDTLIGGSAAGCDSITTLNLNIGSSVTLPTSEEDLVTCAASATINGNTYTIDGTVIDTLTAAAITGCDSVHITNLTLNAANIQKSYSFSNCDSVVAFGVTYYATETVVDTTTGSCGDSITTQNIVVNNSVATRDTVYSCGNYVLGGVTYTSSQEITLMETAANGCDSTHVRDLRISGVVFASLDIDGCDIVTFNGTDYTSNTALTDSSTSVDGCDSVTTVNINVTPSNITEIDTTVNEGDSFEVGGVQITASGVYSDSTANSDGCYDITTYNLTVLSGVNANISRMINVFPNPSKNILNINADKNVDNVRIIDIQGKEQMTVANLNAKNNTIDISSLNDGVYFVRVELTTGEADIRRIVKLEK